MKKVIVQIVVFMSSNFCFAVDAIPHCRSQGAELPIDDARVLNLEKSSPNEFKSQEHVKGLITRVYPSATGHQHFAIQLGNSPSQGIEVVYNTVFGPLPQLRVGITVEACGEYITSNKPTGQFPASPMGAIIHWVHINPNQGVDQHASGFLVVDGHLCGQDASHADHSGHGDQLSGGSK